MRTVVCDAALLLAGLLAGCGYHVSGQGELVPKTIKTIAIPGFQNITTRYQLAKLLPEDISREFLTRTRFKVIADASQADAVLNGAIVNFFYFPTTFDTATGRSTGVEVSVTLRLTLTDRATNAVIWSRPAAEFRERYEVAVNPQQYFDESSTAEIRLSRDVARSVVSALQQAF
ncbi:MAG TPA: LPS assembly lipoprotein LptE [Bryobacteraceae bacterium]|nr:LPS assembly lipoprotein LptE [Bryobacteraceae bacterium]